MLPGPGQPTVTVLGDLHHVPLELQDRGQPEGQIRGVLYDQAYFNRFI